MKITGYTGESDVATVFVAENSEGKAIEFVESVQPPVPRDKKWVLIVSTLFGCPVGCNMCDAGSFYDGKLTKDEILEQIDFLVRRRYPDGVLPMEKFKVQFARMGDPAFNIDVIEVLKELPARYDAPGLMPCISTIAPSGTKRFFDELLDVKRDLYAGRFQLQFSIHSTDAGMRDEIIPVNKWDFASISRYGQRFMQLGDRKIALNFALAKGVKIDPVSLRNFFDPELFVIKITPINPTNNANKNQLVSYVDADIEQASYDVVDKLRACDYEVIVSVGETRENAIGSNCGQYILSQNAPEQDYKNCYTCQLKSYS